MDFFTRRGDRLGGGEDTYIIRRGDLDRYIHRWKLLARSILLSMPEAVCYGHQIGMSMASNVDDISGEPAVSPVSGDSVVGETFLWR